MSDLNKELDLFARAIVTGDAVSAKIKNAYPNYAADVAIEVYRNNYRGNLHDALTGAYPVIVQLVGDEFFRYLAKNHIAHHQSRSENLHHYGAALASFLRGFTAARELPYLPDMAALEWACHTAYFTKDTTPLALENLAQIPPGQYPDLIFHTACQMVPSHYPIAAIWQAHQPDMDGDFHIDLDKGGCVALVSRREFVVQVHELSASVADWLQRIQTGETLGTATTATLEHFPDFDLQTTLLRLIDYAALTGFSLEVKT